jgi:hypothetical protein
VTVRCVQNSHAKSTDACTAGPFFLVEATTGRLQSTIELASRRELAPWAGVVLPLSSAEIAHEMLGGTRPHPRGRIVLHVAE